MKRFGHIQDWCWRLLLCAGLLSGTVVPADTVWLSDPAVDGFNLRVGTQTFGVKYQFTTNTTLVETAEAITNLGSDIIKFYAGKGMPGQYGFSLGPSITSLTLLARDEPSCRRVLDMPFRHVLLWTYAFCATSDAWWKDGYSASEAQQEYAEVYDFTRYLLTNYNNSGREFYLGHWEGDWYLLDNYNTSVNPTPTAIQGMISWLNNRQKAIDDANLATPHSNVRVGHYTEVNRVRDAMVNGSANNQRLVNTVLPYVTNIDFVSWSSYDGQNLGTTEVQATLDYIEAHLPAAKSACIPGKRVFVGEYGWGGTLASETQEPVSRAYMQRLLTWGTPFILFWEMYNNEPGRQYWLIDTNGTRTQCWHLHQRFLNQARLRVAQFKETHGQLPDDAEFAALATPLLDRPLPYPVSVVVSNLDVASLSTNGATVRGAVMPGSYGIDAPEVRVYYGRTNGSSDRSAWETSVPVGLATNFNLARVSAVLTNLVPNTNWFFRFYATNSAGEFWAPSSRRFSTVLLNPADFGSRLRISFNGYSGQEPLENIPLVIRLGTNLPGFSYRGFASGTGRDLRFCDRTGVAEIPYEIEEWNTNGLSTVWVRVPWLEAQETSIWAYWGNPFITNAPPSFSNEDVWSNGFEVAYHLKESGFPYADSAGRHPAGSGDPPVMTTAGLVGRAALFNGTSDYLHAGAVNLGESFTLSAWVKVDPAANSIQTVWANKSGGSVTPGFAFFANSYNTRDEKLLFETGNGIDGAVAATAANLVTPGMWRYVAAVVDRLVPSARLYVDGADVTGQADLRADFANAAILQLGRFTNSGYYFRGTMDEARVETVARSENWLRAVWQNMSPGSGFQEYSIVDRQLPRLEAGLVAEDLVLSWPSSGVGLSLYSATNLMSPVSWSLLPQVPALVGGAFVVRVPMDTVARYFCLWE